MAPPNGPGIHWMCPRGVASAPGTLETDALLSASATANTLWPGTAASGIHRSAEPMFSSRSLHVSHMRPLPSSASAYAVFLFAFLFFTLLFARASHHIISWSLLRLLGIWVHSHHLYLFVVSRLRPILCLTLPSGRKSTRYARPGPSARMLIVVAR